MAPIVLAAAGFVMMSTGIAYFLMARKKTCAISLTPEQRAKRKKDEELLLLITSVVVCLLSMFSVIAG